MKTNSTDTILAELDRRRFLGTVSASTVALFATPGAMAEKLIVTPGMTEGPFYPDNLPLDTDNDLLIINDEITPAVGPITHLTGTVMTAKSEPVRGAVVEIWQCDNNGVYLHSRGGPRKKLDGNFQGFGRFRTDVKGRYYFRTLKPSDYVGRTPHIHFNVSVKGKKVLTSQILIEGDKKNEKDFLYNRIKDPISRQAVLAKFEPLPGSKIGELQANFDIILGVTPQAE